MRSRGSFLRCFADAGAGMSQTLRTQRNARIHAAATVCVVALAVALKITAIEWTVVLLAIGLVWTAEMLNTAIEAVVDLASPDEHELARIAKDTASGGVLVAAIVSVAVGVIVFGPRLWDVFE